MKNRSLHSIVFLTALSMLLSCAVHTANTIIATDQIDKISLLSLVDCAVYSHPRPVFLDMKESKLLIDKINSTFTRKLKSEQIVREVQSIESIGRGLKPDSLVLSLKEHARKLDSLIPPMFIRNSIHDTDSVVQSIQNTLCRAAYLRNRDSLDFYVVKNFFRKDTNVVKLNRLQDLSGSDYCMVTALYGTTKRKPTPMGAKVGTALATGLFSLLSPVGGFIVVPGDETTFKSYSYIIDLSNGRILWQRRYRKYRLFAVENVNAGQWVAKVLRNFTKRLSRRIDSP